MSFTNLLIVAFYDYNPLNYKKFEFVFMLYYLCTFIYVYIYIKSLPYIIWNNNKQSKWKATYNISYNVTVVGGSTMPDVNNGNLILMAHSGDAYISYFAFLYKLSIGNDAYVTYGSNKYRYKLVNIYNVPKNGTITISRNISKTTLTLITCTKNSDTEQTVYIFEMV